MSVSFNNNSKGININNNSNPNLNNIHFHNENDINYENSNIPGLDMLLPSDDEEPQQNNQQNIFDQQSISSKQSNTSNAFNNESFEDIQAKKAYYLTQINRYQELGMKNFRLLDMSHDISEISAEYHRIKYDYDSQQAIKTCRMFMINGVNLLETADNKFNLIGDLQGIAIHTETNISIYDDIFVELYQKYKESLKMSPEMRLVMTFGMTLTQFKMSQMMTRTAKQQQEQALYETINKMNGPTKKTTDALNKLGIDLDSDIDFSDISSVKSEISLASNKSNLEITIPDTPQPKKRGRKKKQTN
jgi:hypothetical protein